MEKLEWLEAPERTQWGADMMEALMTLDKDHTLRLYAEKEAIPLVLPALQAWHSDAADIDDALVVRHLEPRGDKESMRDVINRIVNWEVAVALDPTVSSDAQKLVDQGYSKCLDELRELCKKDRGS